MTQVNSEPLPERLEFAASDKTFVDNFDIFDQFFSFDKLNINLNHSLTIKEHYFIFLRYALKKGYFGTLSQSFLTPFLP